jgi:CheY-like chemotaxis protein
VARILVVEDSPDNMKLFAAVLTFEGHSVVGLPDGRGLLSTVASWTPDVVLMDIQLPDSDGFALLGALREAGHGDLPIVALTAHAMSGDRERALAAGFDGYITKPIQVNDFPAQVAEVLNRAGRNGACTPGNSCPPQPSEGS